MQSMLSLFVLLVVVFAVVESFPPGEDFMKECAKEHSISKEQEGKKDFSKLASEVPENVKCFIKCNVVKNGFLSDAGQPIWAKIEEAWPNLKENKGVVEKCIADTKEDHSSCSFVYSLTKCVLTKFPKPE